MSREIDIKWQRKWQEDGQHDCDLQAEGPKFYLLSMFPYPSGNLHIGHWYAFAPADAFARFQRMHGYNVFFPIGFDAFGLPAENAAIKHGCQPAEWTANNIKRMTAQLESMGCMFSWKQTLKTCSPEYYKWNQWIFLQFYKNDLAYRDTALVDFCPTCQTTIAKEQVLEGRCERCRDAVIQKEMPSWKIRTTKYKQRLLDDFKYLTTWPEKVVKMQTNWINNLHDWNVSRQRMWGTPIPVIYCERCGVLPVPEKDLPIKLPDNAEFHPTGESPLKRHPDFKKCICHKCGHAAERETDTLDTFFCSSWYQFAYLNLENPFDETTIRRWGPVDLYTGGIEHACAHLLYFRFFSKALIDCKIIPEYCRNGNMVEPTKKLFNQGMILGPDHQKMSKSRGNVVDPDELVEDYGADVVRAALMFIGPWDQGGVWTHGLTGIARFLDDVESLANRPEPHGEEDGTGAVGKAVVRTVGRVKADYRALKFNTVISWLMQLRNTMLDNYEKTSRTIWGNAVDCLLLMLAPICPHRTEELWRKDHPDSIHGTPWPTFLTVEKESTRDIVIQVDGKKRLVVVQSHRDTVNEVRQYPEVLDLVRDLEIAKVIAVPDKVINYVTKKTRSIDD